MDREEVKESFGRVMSLVVVTLAFVGVYSITVHLLGLSRDTGLVLLLAMILANQYLPDHLKIEEET